MKQEYLTKGRGQVGGEESEGFKESKYGQIYPYKVFMKSIIMTMTLHINICICMCVHTHTYVCMFGFSRQGFSL